LKSKVEDAMRCDDEEEERKREKRREKAFIYNSPE
jgi:hypothetical protein